MIESDAYDENYRLENINREENTSVRLICDLTDVAWWKRPNLLATRYGIIPSKYQDKMTLDKIHDGTITSGIQLNVLNIHRLQSIDSGIYECETLGAIRQYNLTVTVRLTTIELGAQILSSSSSPYLATNYTDKNLPQHQSLSTRNFLSNKLILNNEHLRLRENQLIRLTCAVSRAYPAVTIIFPFDIDYRIEKNSTIENADKTFRTILILIVPVNRYFHKRSFHCEAIQRQFNYDENKQQQQQIQHRILSNSLQMDVIYGPTCYHKIQLQPQFFTGLHRSINLTCFMHDSNPSKLNFTWLLPNGNKRLGYLLNTTSSYITLTPKTSDDFGQATCRAQNELGLIGDCHIDIIMGGIPDPIESCQYTYLNTTLQVNCVAGFHQGDEDFFCYMYKRQDSGNFSEHARLKGNCAFILPELHPERYHEFRVFTKNKFGDNYDRSFLISVGKPKVESLVDKTRNYWPLMAICILGICLLSFIIICCCCHHIRRSMYKRKTKSNFDSLTYQNHSPHTHTNSNGKQSLVHLKQNGNGTAYPVRPYRSKDYLITSETANTPRNNTAYRTVYSTDDDFKSLPRNPLKETDLDQLLASPSNINSSAMATVKSLPLNHPRPLFAAFGPQIPLDELHQTPLTLQRRSSFQAATKLNGLDFYTAQEPFYLIDRQMMKTNQRSNYSPERDLREREHYREKRREYSPDLKNENLIDINRGNILDTTRSRENSLIVENHMITTSEHLTPTSSTNDQNWREMNAIDEIDYNDRYIETNDHEREDFSHDQFEQHNDHDRDHDENQYFSNDDRRSLDRISIDYRHDDNDTTFANYDRDDDRYRDDGIFV